MWKAKHFYIIIAIHLLAKHTMRFGIHCPRVKMMVASRYTYVTKEINIYICYTFWCRLESWWMSAMQSKSQHLPTIYFTERPFLKKVTMIKVPQSYCSTVTSSRTSTTLMFCFSAATSMGEMWPPDKQKTNFTLWSLSTWPTTSPPCLSVCVSTCQ